MVNQYSWNLDSPQDYLAHSKLGAHYSKNWTKEKQNAYNQWYYKTHRDELAKKRAEYGVDDTSKKVSRLTQEAHEDAEHFHSQQVKYTEPSYTTKNSDGSTTSYYSRNSAGGKQFAQMRKHDFAARKEASDRYYRMADYLRDTNKDKDKLSSKVRYDVETTAKKTVSRISSSIEKLKNKVVG